MTSGDKQLVPVTKVRPQVEKMVGLPSNDLWKSSKRLFTKTIMFVAFNQETQWESHKGLDMFGSKALIVVHKRGLQTMQ